MDTIESLLTDAMVDKLIAKFAKFHKGDNVYCKANQRKAVIVNVIYDIDTDAIAYDIQCGSYRYHAIAEQLLTITR